jgi:hypothetical protein
MKCPLFILNDLRAQSGEETEIGDCLKEECAFWDKPVGRCFVQNVSEKLSFIFLELHSLKEQGEK